MRQGFHMTAGTGSAECQLRAVPMMIAAASDRLDLLRRACFVHGRGIANVAFGTRVMEQSHSAQCTIAPLGPFGIQHAQ